MGFFWQPGFFLMVIQKWHKGVTVKLMRVVELGQRYGITENGICLVVWAKSSSKVPQEFTFCPNRHEKHGANGGQRFGESSDFPRYWKSPIPSGGIWLAATMSLTVVRCWVNC